MGKITYDDRCGVCNESMLEKERFVQCSLCKAYICETCFERSKEERGNICPCCGKSSRK